MIPKTFIDSLIKKANIDDVISEYVELVPNGAQLRGPCPFCMSNKPIFNVSIDKQIFKCFNCGTGGNVIKFIGDIEKKSFPQAVQFLATKLNLEIPKSEE